MASGGLCDWFYLAAAASGGSAVSSAADAPSSSSVPTGRLRPAGWPRGAGAQRDMFARAAAAQRAELASTQGAGIPGVAQEVVDAENYVTTSQANAGYSEMLATGGAGRRLLGEL